MSQDLMSRTSGKLALAALACVAALLSALVWSAGAKADASDYGIDSVSSSLSTTQAGAHPDFSQGFDLSRDPATGATYAGTQDAIVDLPPGLIGNPSEFPTCPAAQFIASATVPNPPCPVDTQIGIANVNVNVGFPGANFTLPEPLYNVTPSPDSPARLGFVAVFKPILIDFQVRSESDYGLTAAALNATDFTPVNAVEVTTWGVPADPSHDAMRFPPSDAASCGGPCGAPIPSGLPPTPFMTNPTSCEPGQTVDFDLTAYPLPGQHFTASAPFPDITGCEQVPFDPATDLQPTSSKADDSTGLDVNFQIDQDGMLHENTLAPSHLKKAVVTLPEGMSLNPSAADGLGSCSEDQIGLTSKSPIRFDTEDPECPNASKVGTSKITTPVLDDPLEGNLYVAEQDDNPFDSLLAGYMVAKGKGVIIKLAGNFERDPDTGQITATFDNNPQQPFSELDLHFKGGARGVLATPTTCGTYEITTELTPWSGNPPVTQTSEFTVDKGPDGGACLAGDPSQPGDPSDLADRPFKPNMNAGLTNPVAGGHSPFVFQLTREDGHQEILSTTVAPPQGLTAKLAGIPYCSEADIAAISCPEESKIGTELAGAGAGSSPFYTTDNPGSVYLAGPYKGAPLSMVITEPVIAGPFDLDDISVRAAIHVDPRTAELTVISDEIPQINSGIPLRVRDLRIKMDRPDFTIAPTNCDLMEVNAEVQGSHGATASLTNHFQVGDCGNLDFSPKLKLDFGKTKKATKPGANPPLNADLSFNEGDSNISQAQVTLPQGVLLDDEQLGFLCSQSRYEAGTCPESSVVGYAKAETPLLDESVEGPVYLKASNNPLPDLAADLNGQIDIDLIGRIDQKQNRKGINQIRNTFDIVPDVPVSHFELKLSGGNAGLLENSSNLCSSKRGQKVGIKMAAHNEMTLSERPFIGSACKQLNKKKAQKLKAKVKKLKRKARKADNPRKAKKLRKKARKLKQRARKLGR